MIREKRFYHYSTRWVCSRPDERQKPGTASLFQSEVSARYSFIFLTLGRRSRICSVLFSIQNYPILGQLVTVCPGLRNCQFARRYCVPIEMTILDKKQKLLGLLCFFLFIIISFDIINKFATYVLISPQWLFQCVSSCKLITALGNVLNHPHTAPWRESNKANSFRGTVDFVNAYRQFQNHTNKKYNPYALLESFLSVGISRITLIATTTGGRSTPIESDSNIWRFPAKFCILRYKFSKLAVKREYVGIFEWKGLMRLQRTGMQREKGRGSRSYGANLGG